MTSQRILVCKVGLRFIDSILVHDCIEESCSKYQSFERDQIHNYVSKRST